LLQGIGRPDLTAKVHLAEVVPFLTLLWILTSHFGLIGTALAWVMRVTADLVLLLLATSRIAPQVRDGYRRHRVVDAASLLLLLSLVSASAGLLSLSGPAKLAIGIVVLTTLLIVTWGRLFDTGDRALIGTVLGRSQVTAGGKR
jgi:O-antigen/teichoic acid export membrane protein